MILSQIGWATLEATANKVAQLPPVPWEHYAKLFKAS